MAKKITKLNDEELEVSWTEKNILKKENLLEQKRQIDELLAEFE